MRRREGGPPLRHLRTADRAALLALLAAWALCFALAAGSAWRGDAISSLYVAPGPGAEDPPRLLGFRPWIDGETTELRPGDRLLRLGSLELSGVGPHGFWARVPEVAGRSGSVELTYARGERVGRARVAVGSHRLLWPYLVISLAFAFTGGFLMLRTRPSPTVRALGLAALVLAVSFASNFAGSRTEAWLSIAVHAGSMTLAAPLALLAVARFPEGVPPLDRRLRWALWGFAGIGVLEAGRFNWGTLLAPETGRAAFFALEGLGFAALLAILTRSWRCADALGRRQLKWIVLGWYAAVAPVLIGAVWAGLRPEAVPVYVASQIALAILPLSLLVATVHFNWFDVDRWLSATVSYNLVGVLALGAVLAVSPQMANAVSNGLGLDPTASHVALGLALAAVAVTAGARLRPRLERSFFPERHALDEAVRELLAEVPRMGSPQELVGHVGERLAGVLRPQTLVAYGRAGEGYAPIYVRGRAVPAAVEAAGPLVRALEERREPLALSDLGSRPRGPVEDPHERAVLESLDAECVVPFWRKDLLVAFLCLGPKRSGDVYTPTDLTRLSLLAARVSARLLLFDLQEMEREGRAMQASLRRYVPGAVAAQLDTGCDPASGRRELSVLFVDLRGYTAYAEPRGADEIFSTVNLYTRAVSGIVSKHGGSVVEFNGDGMMTVFGAPEPLANKERVAVEAAREIVEQTKALALGGREPGAPRLAVAVGIATGETFVGNIQASDRLIWAALGNTTNLAARLETMARELEAAVVVDARTHARAGEAVAGFEPRPGVRVRGRSEALEVFVLPLAAVA